MGEIILGLMGGLGLFLYGMKLMSDALEKAAGAKMRSILEFLPRHHSGDSRRYRFYGGYSILQCSYGYGCQFCEFRTDEFVSGCRCDYGSKYRYYRNLPVDFI